MKEIERKMDIKERENGKRNVIVKDAEVKEGKKREAVEDLLKYLFKHIGAEVEIKKIKRLRGEADKKGEKLLVRLGSEEQRKEIMGKKKNVRDRKEKIWEDWTWGERRMRWKLEEIARKEEKKGRMKVVGSIR